MEKKKYEKIVKKLIDEYILRLRGGYTLKTDTMKLALAQFAEDLINELNHCGKPHNNGEEPDAKPYDPGDEKQNPMVSKKDDGLLSLSGTFEFKNLDADYYNGEHTPHDCNRDIVLTSMPPQYQCSVCGRVFNN